MRFTKLILFTSLAAYVGICAWAWSVAAHPGDPPPAADAAETADAIFVDKSDRRLELHRAGQVIRSYRIALGDNPIGAKRAEGDGRTPEGSYVIDFHKADSAYHLSLHISYPNKHDSAASLKMGVPTGGAIFIHGLPNAYPFVTAPKFDWTQGCIALDNAEIEEVWRLVPDGTPITIRP